MADLPLAPDANNDTGVSPDRSSTRREQLQAPSSPRWMKVFVVGIIILVLLFVILHLTGNGFGEHMHTSTIEQWVQAL